LGTLGNDFEKCLNLGIGNYSIDGFPNEFSKMRRMIIQELEASLFL
jgi:hypothetical protein